MAGIDFGEKRVGIAVSAVDGLALPLRTLERRSDAQLIAELAELFECEQITRVAIGEPLAIDGSSTSMAARVRSFARKLQKELDVEVFYVAETLTSTAARERLQAAGVDVRRAPERIDAVAAQIILEEALKRLGEGSSGERR